ncbi:MAG TPA: anti-sigma factor [Solirubrobacterales bacterium]|nr:anti-sigma factor [Solirubrobacterales bacterium]
MKAESCREWRESLGAYALGQLPDEERAAVEAHLEGCPSCRAEAEQLAAMVAPMSLADPARFDSTPELPSGLAGRVAEAIGRERRVKRRRRVSFGFAFAGAGAALAAVLVLFVLGGSSETGPERHVTFTSLPRGTEVSAKLIPNAFGTEIHMYVKGVSSGTLCRVYLRSRDGSELSAGSFRYRWDKDGGYPILSSGLDLSKTAALELRIGGHDYTAKLDSSESEST